MAPLVRYYGFYIWQRLHLVLTEGEMVHAISHCLKHRRRSDSHGRSTYGDSPTTHLCVDVLGIQPYTRSYEAVQYEDQYQGMDQPRVPASSTTSAQPFFLRMKKPNILIDLKGPQASSRGTVGTCKPSFICLKSVSFQSRICLGRVCTEHTLGFSRCPRVMPFTTCYKSASKLIQLLHLM